jgi:hypothetical protein
MCHALESNLDSFLISSSISTVCGKKSEPFQDSCVFIIHMPKMPDKYITKIAALPGVKTFFLSNLEVQCGKQVEEPHVSV